MSRENDPADNDPTIAADQTEASNESPAPEITVEAEDTVAAPQDPSATDLGDAPAASDGEAAPSKARSKMREKIKKERTKKAKRVVDADNLDLITLDDGTKLIAGTRHPKKKRFVFIAQRPVATVVAILKEQFTYEGHRTLLFYAGEFLHWVGNRYETAENVAIARRVSDVLDASFEAIPCDSFHRLEPYPSTARQTDAVVQVLKQQCYAPMTLQPTCFLAPPPVIENLKVEASDLICMKSDVLHVPTMTSLVASPLLFNIASLDFDYDPAQTSCPTWLWFLNVTFSGDAEQIQALQEFMGYLLVSDTRYQKALVILGPSGAGKGTLLRLIVAMIGKSRVASPTAANLASNFGLSSLVGKPLAMITDARFNGPDLSKAIEQLLRVIGEDAVDIDKKYAQPMTVTLPTRIIIATNEIPKLPDAADAFARRFLVINTPNQVDDAKVNPEIEPAIHAEIAAIFCWALEGLRRLRARGRFVQPKSSMQWKQDMSELSSPLKGFARDCVEFTNDDEDRVTVDELYARYARWCASEGREHKSVKSVMCRDWNAAFPKYRTYQRSDKLMGVRGLQLNSDYATSSDSQGDYTSSWR